MYFYNGTTKSSEILKPPSSKRFSLEQKMRNVHRNCIHKRRELFIYRNNVNNENKVLMFS